MTLAGIGDEYLVEGEIVPNRWGKVGKVVLFLILFLLAVAGIGFGGYFRYAGFGEVLAREAEIKQKAKQYKMYETRAEFDAAISNLPKGYEMEAELTKIVHDFRNNTKNLNSTLDAWGFRRSRKQKRLFLTPEIPKINSALAKSKAALANMISRRNPIISDSWAMEKFFPNYDLRGTNQIHEVQDVLLIEAWQAAEDSRLDQAKDSIRLEARVRRYIASHSSTVEGAVYAVESWRTATLAYQCILDSIKSPPVDLVREMRQCLETPIPFDFKHYTRTCFYIGADWFPKGKTISEEAVDEGKFLRFHPSIVKAWKLHLQNCALLAYEAGAGQPSKIEALEASITAFSDKIYDLKVYDSMRWALPDGGMGYFNFSQEHIDAQKKLDQYFRTYLKTP